MSHLGTTVSLGLAEGWGGVGGGALHIPYQDNDPFLPHPMTALSPENSKQAAQLLVERQLNNLALAWEARGEVPGGEVCQE